MKTLAALVLLSMVTATASAGTFVYVSIAGDQRIAVYQMDADGKLTHRGSNFCHQFLRDPHTGDLRPNPVAPRLETPPNTGPRHLVFHPANKAVAFVDNEQGGSVAAYAVDTKTGTLKPLQTVSTLPA